MLQKLPHHVTIESLKKEESLMFFHKKGSVEMLDCSIDLSNASFFKDACLVHIQGQGILRTRYYHDEKDPYAMNSQIKLYDTPLLQIHSSECPTCPSLLATGYGLDQAGCKALYDIQENINAPFVSVERSIENLQPLLTLLESGLYVIADTICYPTDGNEHFFWDTPNDFTENPATAAVFLPNYHYEYVDPCYLYPTQNTDCYHEERVNYYKDLFQKTKEPPRAIVYNFGLSISYLLDGHHKACAAALLHQPVKCIMIIPLSGYAYPIPYHTGMKPDRISFSTIDIPIERIPKRYLPKRSSWKTPKEIMSKHPGIIDHRIWEPCYLESVSSYPTIMECAVMQSLDIPMNQCIPDNLIQECFNQNDNDAIDKLIAILYLLHYQKDPRRKQVAIQCSKLFGTLKKTAYQILSYIKSDAEVEQLFIDYLVECEDPHDMILPIIHSYWE